MGWETIGRLQPQGITLGIYADRGKARQYHRCVLSFPKKLLPPAWIEIGRCAVLMGNEEHYGKLAMKPDANGAHTLKGKSGRHYVWFASDLAPHKADEVRYQWDGEALVIDLPAWALTGAPKPPATKTPDPCPPEAPADRIAYTKPAEPEPKLAAPPSVDEKPKRRDPEPETLKGKDWSPETTMERDHRRLNPLGDTEIRITKRVELNTDQARKLPASKPSETEPPPAWRGKAEKPESTIITSKNKINMVGHIVEAGGRAMTLKGDEIKLMAILVGAEGKPVTPGQLAARNVPEVIKSIRAKILERKLPLVIHESNGRYALDW